MLFPTKGQVIYVLLTRPPLALRRVPVRLACIRHAASVCPEPGSNSPNKNFLRKSVTQTSIKRFGCSDELTSCFPCSEETDCVIFVLWFPHHSSVVKVTGFFRPLALPFSGAQQQLYQTGKAMSRRFSLFPNKFCNSFCLPRDQKTGACAPASKRFTTLPFGFAAGFSSL